MEKIREFYQNNKRGFLMLGVLVILVSIWILTKPKPKTISQVTSVPSEEILPPAPREEVVEIKTSEPVAIPAQNQQSTLVAQSSQYASSNLQPAIISQKSSIQNLLISDISKYFTGKIDPYSPLIVQKKGMGGTEKISNIDINSLPWPDENNESSRPKPLRLCGVIFDKEPIAVISEERGDFIVKVGDSFLDYKVKDISLNQVVLKRGSDQKVLKIE